MSYVQNILNRRLGIQKTIEIEKRDEPPKIKEEPPEEPPEETPKEPQPKAVLPRYVPAPKKNARGAGRKKQNEEETEKKRAAAVNRLTKGNIEDLHVVNELRDNTTKDELVEEIKNTKRKLQLLNDAVLFADK